MKSSNAAVRQDYETHRPVDQVKPGQKPTLRSVESHQRQCVNLPKLGLKEALQDAINRTG